MTANIFGSSFKTSSLDKKYIDSKFITLSQNLQFKLDKNGDKMQGEFNMGGNRITNVKLPVDRLDVVTKEYVDTDVLMLNESLQLKLDKSGGVVSGDINMGGNKITNVYDPINPRDVVTKQYMEEEISNLYTLSTNGLVPHLTNSMDESGFFVSTSSYLRTEYMGYKVFNPSKNTQWKVENDIEGEQVATNFWIEVNCPEFVRVYKFVIEPSDNTVLVRFKIQGRVGLEWEDLPFNTEQQKSDHTFTLQNPSLAALYNSYRIFFERALGLNPGLCYCQLYTVNPVYRSQ